MTDLVGTDETCHEIPLTSDTFGQFRPVPPPKSPWHAACNYSNIINPHTSRIMNIIDHPVFTSIRQARAYYRIRRAGAGTRFAAVYVRAAFKSFTR